MPWTNKTRQDQAPDQTALTVVSADVTGGQIIGRDGLRIAGMVQQTSSITTSDRSAIVITGVVRQTIIEGGNISIQGEAIAVVIAAHGSVDIGPKAVIVGTIYKSAHTALSIEASADIQDLTIKTMPEGGLDSIEVRAQEPEKVVAA